MTLRLNRRHFLAGSAGLLALHPFSLRAAANQAHLRLMETTDLHVHVFPYDYYADKEVDTVGLSRTASIVKSIRAEATNTLMLDNGDFLQGNPMGDYIAYERGMKEGDMHPVIQAMNTLGYDASTLGNHEFNYGLDFLMKSLAGADFPAVPCHDLRWDRRHLEGKVQARDILEAARAWVPQMKEADADIVIALSHSGIGAAKEEDMMENASVPLAAVEGIDAIMTGHSHLVFPSGSYADYPGVDVSAGTIHGKPATMGGFWGSHLGLVDLMLERDAGGWRIASHSAEARAISQRNEDRSVMPLVESDAEVLASVQQDHDETLAYVRRAVGKTDANLHSYFALVADDPSVQVVSNAQRWYIAQMLKGTEHEELPIGAQVKDWLERSAGMFNQITPGEANQPLLNPEFPSYNFDVIDGVSYQIDLSQPSKFGPKGTVASSEASRIVNLEFEGQPLDPNAEFIIATNNYRASGGGAFPGAKGDTIVFEGPDTNRDVIVRYIVEKGTISPRADGNWRFAPMEGTSVVFETGPKAADYVDEVTGVAMEQVGDTENGFAQFRITL